MGAKLAIQILLMFNDGVSVSMGEISRLFYDWSEMEKVLTGMINAGLIHRNKMEIGITDGQSFSLTEEGRNFVSIYNKLES